MLPLKNLMADYFATLLCTNINVFYDEYGQFSAEKTAAFLAAAENQLRNDPAFNGYTLDFPEDFSDIIDRIEALEGDCEGLAEIAQRLTTEMKGAMPADAYNEAAAKSYPAVEAAAREELAPEDHVPKPASIKLTTNATENKCIPIAVLIYTLKSSILYKHNLQLHDLPEKCLTTQESNVIVNPAINEMTLPLVKVSFSESFLADGLTITTPTLVALVDPNDAKRVVIMRGSLPLLVFALDTEYNAKRLADYFGVAPIIVPSNPDEYIYASGRAYGWLSAEQESGRAGGCALGYDSKGGCSYGNLQMAVKTGKLNEFAQWLNKKYENDPTERDKYTYLSTENITEAKNAESLKACKTVTLSTEWLAMCDDENFEKLQHGFISEKNYKPTYDKLMAMFGGTELFKDMNAIEEEAVKELCYSLGVQHGGAFKVFQLALLKDYTSCSNEEILDMDNKDCPPIEDNFSAKSIKNQTQIDQMKVTANRIDIGTFIDRVYAARKMYVKDNKVPGWANMVKNRYTRDEPKTLKETLNID